MSDAGTAHRIAAEEAVDLAARSLSGMGVDAEPATLQAQHLVEAELRGHPSHGLRRLPVLIDRIRAGLIVPNAAPSFEWRARGALCVDGNRGLGPSTAYATIDEVLRGVEDSGVVVAAVRRSHHLGMLAPYVERLADRGCIGMVLSSTEGLVHPWGGRGPLLGTNPIAIGVPSEGGDLILDMSTGSVSAGKILDHLERGIPLPEGWAVDEAGVPTRDPAAAVRGAVSPFGGPKGYGLGIALGALVGVLTGTSFGPDVVGTLDTTYETTKGDVIFALSPDAFGQSLPSRPLAEYLDAVRGSGVDGRRVHVPGDRARAERASTIAEGFDVTDEVWQALDAERGNDVLDGTRRRP